MKTIFIADFGDLIRARPINIVLRVIFVDLFEFSLFFFNNEANNFPFIKFLMSVLLPCGYFALVAAGPLE